MLLWELGCAGWVSIDVPWHNRLAWDRQVAQGNPWTVPVSSEVIARARRGDWTVVLTPNKPVPRSWLGELSGRRLLALASAGGQQAPVFAAAGAIVSVLDNSPAQLSQDRAVAEREGLALDLQLGEMTDLTRFPDQSFDIVFHPCSNVFVPDIRPVWRECFRVLRPGGTLMAGFTQPVAFLFDPDRFQSDGALIVRRSLPYSDIAALPPEELKRRLEAGETLEFGHTLDDQIGGQLDAGFVMRAFFEDRWDHPIDRYINTYAATWVFRPEKEP